MMTARHIFTITSLLLALSAAPAFAQTAPNNTPSGKTAPAEGPRASRAHQEKGAPPVAPAVTSTAQPNKAAATTVTPTVTNNVPTQKVVPAAAPAETAATVPANKPGGIAGWLSSLGKSANKPTTPNVANAGGSQTQRHVHTYLARNYDHRSGHSYLHGKGTTGTTSAIPASTTGGFFSRFKKSSTSQ